MLNEYLFRIYLIFTDIQYESIMTCKEGRNLSVEKMNYRVATAPKIS